jgi:hypothetical protein
MNNQIPPKDAHAMDGTSKLGVRILSAALVLGILGDTLLRGVPWGINFALWVLMLGAFVAALGWRSRAFLNGGAGLLVLMALFVSTFAWRDSLALNLLSVLGLLVIFALIVLRAQGGWLVTAYLTDYVAGGIIAGLNATFGPFFLLLGDLPWRRIFGKAASQRTLAISLGTLLSVPPLVVFGALLMSADAVFNSLVREVLDIDFTKLLGHVFLTAFLAWIVCGYLRGALLGKERDLVPRPSRQWLEFGIIEVGVPLGLLNLLFLVFVVVQFGYFFGGAASVSLTPGLTYSEYARRGFFELVAVSALVLPLLLFAHWALVKDDAKAERIFRWLAGFQLAMLAVIMASAFQRMRLYQHEYGLTEQRLYPTAFMAWLAVVFVWFALTALRGERQRFAFGAMVAGFLLLGALHAMNPDALIVRVNAARLAEGRKFDVHYATGLSADAVPELLTVLPNLPPTDRCIAATRLLRDWSPPSEPDWRTWSYSRARATELVIQNSANLRRMACPERLSCD